MLQICVCIGNTYVHPKYILDESEKYTLKLIAELLMAYTRYVWDLEAKRALNNNAMK